MSSNTEISISLYLRTILKGDLALKSAFEREMSAAQPFERTAGSTQASLLCARGYLAKMAPGTVKRSTLQNLANLSRPMFVFYHQTMQY